MIGELLLGVIGLVILAYFWMWKVKWAHWKKLGVKYIEPTFPYGSLPELFNKKTSLSEATKKLAEDTKFVPYIGGYSLHLPVMIVQDPELAKAIMVKDFDVFTDRQGPGIHKIIEKGGQKADQIMMTQMSNAQGDMWKSLRTTFSPIFTSGKMKAMMIFINETSKRLTSELDVVAEKEEAFEAKSYLGKFSMDTIASCAFGVDAKVYAADKSIFVEYASELFRQDWTVMFKFMLMLIPVIGPFIIRTFKLSFTPQKETLFFYDIISKTLKKRKETEVRRNDLIDMMMDAIKGDMNDEKEEEGEQFEKDAKLEARPFKKVALDEEAIVATALVIMVAGYDTTGSTLSYACYQLSKNFDIQERLRDEVMEVVQGREDEDLTYDDLKNMTYMDQILAETLRFHTPLGILQRSAKSEYTLPGTDVPIMKGREVWINPQAMHFSEEHYQTPYKFNPEHFSPEAKSKRHPYAFLPFGQGPRGCIGMRFALLEAKLALAKMVLRYNLLPSEKTAEPLVEDPNQVISYPKKGIYIKLEKRV